MCDKETCRDDTVHIAHGLPRGFDLYPGTLKSNESPCKDTKDEQRQGKCCKDKDL